MRVTLMTDGGAGGFPWLTRPIVADTDVLALDLSERLRMLVKQARFFQLPNTVGPKVHGAPELQIHTVMVEDMASAHRVAAVETAIPAQLRALVDFVKAYGTRA